MAKNKLLFIPQFEEAEGGGGGKGEEGERRVTSASLPNPTPLT